MDDPAPSRASRKLFKQRPKRRESVQYPRHLQEGDDAEEDVTAPKGAAGPQFMHLNQSMLSLITAAGSNKDFHSRFDDDESSDTEDDQATEHDARKEPEKRDDSNLQPLSPAARPTTDRPHRTQSALRRSLPKLRLSSKRERNYMSHSMILPPLRKPFASPENAKTPRDAPVLARMVAAQAQLNPPSSEVADAPSPLQEGLVPADADSAESLEIRLQEIFGFDAAEDVLAEYPVWLLQSVLLQGYMYITSKHVAFYAYLPKRSAVVAKSGYLAKRGKQNPKFNRYWFMLKGDVLSYYLDPSDLYFSSGNIDLRYGISAALLEHSKDKSKETHFTVTTHQRTYFFRADSPASAREWVKTLQKVIFRSHNDGDSVKISLPIANIIDIEEMPVIDFAETVKIRVIDSDETYAIDEYFFSFFSFGKDALGVLRSLVETSSAELAKSPGAGQPKPEDANRLTLQRHDTIMPLPQDKVHTTLSPAPSPRMQSPRASGDWGRSSMDGSRRRSLDMQPSNLNDEKGKRTSTDHSTISSAKRRTSLDCRGRRSLSTSRGEQNTNRTADPSPASKEPGSSDSFVRSVDQSATNDSSDVSASQILSRSDVFRSPTLHHTSESGGSDHRLHRRSGSTSSLPETHAQAPTAVRHASTANPMLPTAQNHGVTHQDSNLSLQELVKGSFPLKKAAGFAGYLRRGSKKMGSLLASESMGYVEKVSGMWAGGRKHYTDSPQVEGVDPEEDLLEDENVTGQGDRFRAHFALPETEKLQATYFGYLHRVLPLYGKIYIGDKHFCFRSLLPGTKTRLILPLAHIENVTKERGFSGIRYVGLVIVIQAFEELFFEFRQTEIRDDCAITLLQCVDSARYVNEFSPPNKQEEEHAKAAQMEHKLLQEARRRASESRESRDPNIGHSAEAPAKTGDPPTILFDDPRASIINFKPTESLRITCLTIGSRGDVQPYIALCKGLLAEGHKPKIATHAEFEPWIRKHGIDFAPVDGDPAELMRICIENGMFTYSFLKEASAKFRGWIDDLLTSAWKACQESDLLIESPSAMAGIHIAEALRIPYFRAFTMPWTRTRAYPHAFAVPERKMGGAYNYVTYVMFDNVFWTAIAGQVNRWRKKELGLRGTNLDKLHPNKVPFLYNFSPSVVVPPLDYSDWIRVTGYWFLDEAADWQPPKELTDFISQARADGKKLVYIGFGSIVVSDPVALTRTVVESVLKADVRCILSKGWSDRLGSKDPTLPEVSLPPEIHQIKSAPHDWLFRQIDAAAHHGGSGTTGASLRAGVPTIIKPFFGDQFFFGSRVEDLGVGICMNKLNVSVFSRAIWEAVHSERMIKKAKLLGEHIREENGVATAIQAIYRDLEYAKTLIKTKNPNGEPDLDLENEESWTFIGDESDPELIRRIAEWKMPIRSSQDEVRPTDTPKSKRKSFSHYEHHR